MTFEKYSTTYKTRYRHKGFQLNCLEVCLLLALQDIARCEVEQQTPDYLRSLWRRYLASNLEHGEWRKKGWSNFGRMGWAEWFTRSWKGLWKLDLVPLSLAPPYVLRSDTLELCHHFRERMQQRMPAPDFATYCRTTHQHVTGKRKPVWIP